MARHSEARIQQIRDHLRALERRGVSVAQFAEEIGVSMWTLYAWRKRFGPTDLSTSARLSPPRADLIEVDRPGPGAAIEILTDSLTVRIPPGCDAEHLDQVLQAVLGC